MSPIALRCAARNDPLLALSCATVQLENMQGMLEKKEDLGLHFRSVMEDLVQLVPERGDDIERFLIMVHSM